MTKYTEKEYLQDYDSYLDDMERLCKMTTQKDPFGTYNNLRQAEKHLEKALEYVRQCLVDSK